ncbi:hypothetical protein SERLA73DRAFT_181999 [Serpula lacrymans var. lacrymans S7.3]|uniref:Uncharacterized protein n=2 Tax=Serpula lacrymans var. lacrymans TaxID=341189 RepID=F8PZ40_SERL3|nr:uncharacterized protein SERLADRAFT_468436 [Serpula lacrymans var. lacrymans S7.9]EGN99153.1 hypothetical protein SERLA73DRAFT_181999 [Serpula lacrymans var. lacrymans S7.3]EGO24722.1 hypothetical protein SERLADRAFT_468436 [Serpula lacrymans var. lacrymans S7.9]
MNKTIALPVLSMASQPTYLVKLHFRYCSIASVAVLLRRKGDTHFQVRYGSGIHTSRMVTWIQTI